MQYLEFLCRYWAFAPVSSETIHFSATACEKLHIPSEMLKIGKERKLDFHSLPVALKLPSAYACGKEDLILTEVQETLGYLSELWKETTHVAEVPLPTIGSGDIVLFTGGPIFNSCDISTAETCFNRLLHGVVVEHTPGSRHPYKVAFPCGPTIWVNKSTLVRSTLGHVSY